jgi:hypothetical protein
LRHRLWRRSQTRSVLSSAALSKYLPPVWNTRPRTQLSCPVRVKTHRPVDTSQILMDLSREPDAKKGPVRLDFLWFSVGAELEEEAAKAVASWIAAVADSGAQATHSTTCSCSRISIWRLSQEEINFFVCDMSETENNNNLKKNYWADEIPCIPWRREAKCGRFGRWNKRRVKDRRVILWSAAPTLGVPKESWRNTWPYWERFR